VILHLLSAHEWAALADADEYAPPSLASEGFIHCTGDDDLMLEVANLFYTQLDDALVLSIDEHDLHAEVRWEPPDDRPGLPLFPHVYGPLNLDAVVGVRRLVRDADGRFTGYLADWASD
jgi:uncharacterized protein (DUF952 family)